MEASSLSYLPLERKAQRAGGRREEGGKREEERSHDLSQDLPHRSVSGTFFLERDDFAALVMPSLSVSFYHCH